MKEIVITINNKQAVTLANRLSKKLSFGSGKDVEDLLNLVKILYINDHLEEAEQCCNLTMDLEFDGNFGVWDFIHHIWSFRIRILQQKGKEDAARALIESIDSHFRVPTKLLITPEKRYAQYLKNRGRCVLADLACISQIENTPRGEPGKADWKFTALSKLIEPITLNNMPLVLPQEAEVIFKQYISDLKQTKKYGCTN